MWAAAMTNLQRSLVPDLSPQSCCDPWLHRLGHLRECAIAALAEPLEGPELPENPQLPRNRALPLHRQS